ncbi:MAG: UDP-glucose/GDP-mannose dehydrogenase family protein [Gordonia sp. (in: high G+C Gram-positive bacteria)]|uniref:UDP-glucose dehydrogenase family protein n=1 Tax=Gordonia sp. (in: high G+C Gram-positive bacteria) TaxID=84139 RepID=UPI0039E66AA2
MKMTVIGCGYLGATHAACMAELGHEVLGIDVDAAKIEALAAGSVPFFEPGLDDVLRRNIAAGRLRFTGDFAEAARFGKVHFIGVGTPQQANSDAADLTHLRTAVRELVGHLRGDHLIVGKSTVPVGTCAEVAEEIAALSRDATIELAWNPEFLREGFAVDDTLRPDRIVVGTDPQTTASTAVGTLTEVYRPIIDDGTPFLTMDWATAELVKVSANAFLATKISFINAISEICEVAGGDVTALADAIGHDARIGRRFLNAGLGFGGGCLPKDIRAFAARAEELGVGSALHLLREVDAVNMRRRAAVVAMAERACDGSVLGRNIAVLGASFKPESDDVRDSPALAVAAQLSLLGARVSVFDPKAAANAARVQPSLRYAESAPDAACGADLVIVATEWAEFVHMAPAELSEVVSRRLIIDARRCLDGAAWTAAGWDYRMVGSAPQGTVAGVRAVPFNMANTSRIPLHP